MCLAHRLDVLQPAMIRLGRDDDRRAMAGLPHEVVRTSRERTCGPTPRAGRRPIRLCGHSRGGLAAYGDLRCYARP